MITDITGIIIADHNENLFDSNISLLEIEGQKLIEKICDIMGAVFEKNYIVTADPDKYNFVDTEKIQKEYVGLEPLADIYSSIKHSDSEKVFVVSSNLPFLQKSILEFLPSFQSDGLVILPKVGNKIEYHCGIYDRRILPVFENILIAASESISNKKPVKDSALSLWNFIERMDAYLVDIEYELFYFNDLFFKIESDNDFEYVKEKII